jgi:hypothetical protein
VPAARADKRRSTCTPELVRSRRGPKHSRTAHARIRMKAHTRHTGRRTTEAERRDSDARLHGAPPPRQLHSQSRQHPHSGLHDSTPEGARVGQPWHGEHPANAPKCATEATIPSSNGGAPKHSSAEGPQPGERRSARPGGLDTPMIGLQGFEPTRDPYPTSAVLPPFAGRSSHGLDPLQGVPLATLKLCKDNISSLGLSHAYQPKPTRITALQSFKELRDGPFSVRRVNPPEVFALRPHPPNNLSCSD